jgi:hypothetical protein
MADDNERILTRRSIYEHVGLLINADHSEVIGVVCPYMLRRGEIPVRALQEAVARHNEAFQRSEFERMCRPTPQVKSVEEFVTDYRGKRGVLLTVVTQPDRLASFVMTRQVYEEEYRRNPLRLTAETIDCIKDELSEREFRREWTLGMYDALSR